MAIIIDGKKVAEEIKEKIAKEIVELKSKGINPGLAVVLVGENPASKVYVKNKEKDCEQVGILSKEYKMPEDTTEKQLLELIAQLNADKEISGILVQLPLPNHIDEKTILNAIVPHKDVDAFHPINVGRIMIGDYSFLPCTPSGVMELIKTTEVDISGKNCVVLGRSNIVGKPMAMLMLHANTTVTICHSKTANIKEVCKNADILIVAIGKAKYVTEDMVKKGAIVIDVGMNRDENGKLCGDVDFENVKDVAGYITPVPGGVGPMTRLTLLQNTIIAAKEQSI